MKRLYFGLIIIISAVLILFGGCKAGNNSIISSLFELIETSNTNKEDDETEQEQVPSREIESGDPIVIVEEVRVEEETTFKPATVKANEETKQILEHLRKATESKMESVEIKVSSKAVLPETNDILSLQTYIRSYQVNGFQYSDGSLELTFTFQYFDSKIYVDAYRTKNTSKLSAKEKEVLAVIEYVISNYTSPNKSQYENQLAIHDYIVKNCEYDYREDRPKESFEPYGALVNKKAVCQGYAWAFMIFMDILGIENQLITGTADGVGHMWNMVRLDGEWYHVDVTWNDPVGGVSDQIRHYYFNVPDSVIAFDHEFEKSRYPVANGTKYNYYRMNQLYAENQNQFNQILDRELSTKATEIVIAGNAGVSITEDAMRKYVTGYQYSTAPIGSMVIYTITPNYR